MSRPAEGYRPHDFATDLAAFMDALQLEAAVISGGSNGGIVARRFAIDYPERTLGLVLLGSPATLRDKPGGRIDNDAPLGVGTIIRKRNKRGGTIVEGR